MAQPKGGRDREKRLPPWRRAERRKPIKTGKSTLKCTWDKFAGFYCRIFIQFIMLKGCETAGP